MAQGFKDIQVPSFDEDSGYETIFEKLKQEAVERINLSYGIEIKLEIMH